jgi:integrase
MASLYRIRNGWKIAYVVGNRRRYTPLIRSEKLARRKLADLEQVEEAVRLGLADPKAEGYARHAAAALTDHVKAWGKSMTARKLTAKHCRAYPALVLDVCKRADFTRIADLTAERVQEQVEQWGRFGKRVDDRSLATLNVAIAAFKAFSHWMDRTGRTAEDRLRHLVKYNARTDPKRQRREYTPEEAAALVRAAELDPAPTEPYRPGGRDRAMLYRVALGTGLRLNELKSLTARSLHLMGTHPYVALAAKDEKNRKGARQPIPQDLARRLRDWIKGRDPDAPLWQYGTGHQGTPNRQLARDQKSAGIVTPDADGRVLDFHSLRHTYITWGLRAGISLRVMQELARHSDPKLTVRYGHVGVVDVDGALGKLPDVGDVGQQKKEQA